MEVRFAPNAQAAQRMTTEELRNNFLIDNLFIEGNITLVYSDVDRAIVGGIVPASKVLQLLSSKKEMAADFFCERREIGVINAGGNGSITVDGKLFEMQKKDVLYIGRGAKEIFFSSAKGNSSFAAVCENML